ncbi:MAG TPA: hypothetical protein VJ372_21150 [Pyrinomonadaceae bacterium]|nr:hypothetical protein [Pyrinomonadaceae bacterium]
MGHKNGDFGTIDYTSNNISVAAQPNSLGELTMTSDTGDLVQCFWDGSQWVCNTISFKNTFVQLSPYGVVGATALNKKEAKVRKGSKSRKK